MALHYTPKTDKELQEANLLPKGKYGFKINEAKEAISKKNNPMTHLKLEFYHGENKILLDDYIGDWNEYKLKDLAYAVGLSAEYDNGTLDTYHFDGKIGYANLDIQVSKNPEYPADKNIVAKYLRDSAVNNAPALDDGIPFGFILPFIMSLVAIGGLA